jgi:hypothetical protein
LHTNHIKWTEFQVTLLPMCKLILSDTCLEDEKIIKCHKNCFWTVYLVFDVHVTVHCDKFRIIKPTRCTNFSILFWNKSLHVSDSSSVHHQEYFTVHTAMVYVIPCCGQLASRIRMELSSTLILLASCPQNGMTYTIAVCTVKYSWWWTEELPGTCRDSFQNKIEKLVHLVGFIIRKSTL